MATGKQACELRKLSATCLEVDKNSLYSLTEEIGKTLERKMHKLLLISLEFPPVQVAGSFRALRFVTHLPKFGIQPIVVCYNSKQFVKDPIYVCNPSLSALIPSDTPIYQLDVSALEPSRKALVSDPLEDRLSRHFYKIADMFERIRSEHCIESIFVTCPPFNVDLLAHAAKKFFKCPMVLDMRDAWSQWGSSPFRTYFHYRSILSRERRLLHAADAITAVTPQLVDMERKVSRKPIAVSSPACEFHWIPNAYDHSSLPVGMLKAESDRPRYKVVYVGQFYYNSLYETPFGIVPWYRKKPHRWFHYHATRQRWIYRTPYFFFRAWQKFQELYPHYRDRFEFHYLGNIESWLPKMARDFNLEGYCTWHGFKSKQETKQILENSDLCLSTSMKIEGEEDYCLASKTFDYIAARKPVLAFVTNGMQKDFLLGSNIALMCEPDDEVASASQMKELVERGFETEINSGYLQQFSADETTRRMASVILSMPRARGGQ